MLIASALTLAACAVDASPDLADGEDEPSATEAAQSTEDALTVERVSIPLAPTRDEKILFRRIEDLRDYFGTSCGLFCTKPWNGPINFELAADEIVVVLSRAKSAPGKSFAVTAARRSQQRWLRLTTCAKAGTGPAYAFVKVKNARGPLHFVADEGDQGPCR